MLFEKGSKVKITKDNLQIMERAGMNIVPNAGVVEDILEVAKFLNEDNKFEDVQVLVVRFENALDEGGNKRELLMLWSNELESIDKHDA